MKNRFISHVIFDGETAVKLRELAVKNERTLAAEIRLAVKAHLQTFK